MLRLSVVQNRIVVVLLKRKCSVFQYDSQYGSEGGEKITQVKVKTLDMDVSGSCITPTKILTQIFPLTHDCFSYLNTMASGTLFLK